MSPTWLPTLRETLGGERTPAVEPQPHAWAGRRLALVRGNLHIAKLAAHAADATVNDVLMAAVAGGFRALLSSRRERVDEVVLRAYVPVSLHGQQARPSAEEIWTG